MSREIDLPIPKDVDERIARRNQTWDAWYSTLPDDLRRKLSLHDFKRLGDCFKEAFGVGDVRPPRDFDWAAFAELRKTSGGPIY